MDSVDFKAPAFSILHLFVFIEEEQAGISVFKKLEFVCLVRGR